MADPHPHSHRGDNGHILCCGRTDPAGNNIYKLPSDEGASCRSDKAPPDIQCSAEHRTPFAAVVQLTMDDGEQVFLCLRHWETHRQGHLIWVYEQPTYMLAP